MRALIFFVPLMISVSAAALGQSVTPVTGVALSSLPPSNLADGVKPSDALRAAQGALATGRLGETQDALEMAETRLLDRSVALGQTNNPSADPTVGQISQALQALAARDRATCMALIQTAIGSAMAQGL